jgi:hypothetical protein
LRKKKVDKVTIDDFFEDTIAPVAPVQPIPRELPRKQPELPEKKKKVNNNGYFLITSSLIIKGKPYKIYCRGYKLKSWLDFEEGLGYSCTYEEISKEEYHKHDPFGSV